MKDEFGVYEGMVIGEKYRLGHLLGTGGMGSVWLADHLTLGSQVAVKVLKPSVASDESSRARFIREAKAAALLRSPHVVQILDQGTHDETVFIIMERLEGESLNDCLKREGRLGPALTYRIMLHVARAVGRAHDAGIVHRDLKPGNIFLVHNDDEIIGKVLDFGIAKSQMLTLENTDSPQTKTGVLLGTPYYVSPEQAKGDTDIDHRSDLWAMGVIAFQCLCGQRPFGSDSLVKLLFQICGEAPPVPSQVAPVPAGFDEWFLKAVQREREHRFQSAKEMASALHRILSPESTSASAQLMVPTPHQLAAIDTNPSLGGSNPGTLNAVAATQRQQRRRWTIGTLALLLGAAGIGAAIFFGGGIGSGDSTSEAPTPASSAASPDAIEIPTTAPEATENPAPETAESAKPKATESPALSAEPTVSAKPAVPSRAPIRVIRVPKKTPPPKAPPRPSDDDGTGELGF